MITTKDDIADEVSRYSSGFREALPEDSADASFAGNSPADTTLGGLGSGDKLAGGVSFQSQAVINGLKKEGYLDEPAKPSSASPVPVERGASVDDQIRTKKAMDRQKQKDFMLDDIRRANPKGTPKEWDSRAEEKLKAAGW